MAQAEQLRLDTEAPDTVESSTPEGARDRPSDWGSLVADLSSGHKPAWRIHDRTHLEFAVDYPLDPKARSTVWEWQAYFFIPESLRLDGKTYGKQDIYADLQSYVRFAVPDVPFGELAGVALDELREVVRRGVSDEIVRELRLFACRVRAAGVRTGRAITDALEAGADARTTALAATARMVTDARRITSGLREQIAALPEGDDTLRTAATWVDEDVSRLIETIFGSLSHALEKADAPAALRQSVVDVAVAEARYRAEHGLEGVGHVAISKREVESLEFRRHVLKRFTSSVLWLKPEVREGARIVLEVLYAVAAGVAMAFALAAAILNGTNPMDDERLWMWCAIAVLAYMGKDRIKASLQQIFSKVVSRHFPDRRWRILDRERGVVLGKVDEHSAFVPFDAIPEPVLAKRRSTRKHPLEEQARPENVLWHRKVVRLSAERVAQADPRFGALTEIFRLDLRRWLAHTDDPKRKIVFADPVEGRVCDAVAPRVYNIGVVYRLRRKDDESAPWQRLRVVVSRKGIRRIDHIR
ncbi:MAG TPA: hypothetical protein VIL20_05410 [Sandaracinaceae bacterium]